MTIKKAALIALIAAWACRPTSIIAAEDILTQSAKWMKISGYIIGTAVACGTSQEDALPIGNKIIENTASATGNNVTKQTLAEIHARAFLGSIKMQKKIGTKGCDVAIKKYNDLKNFH